MSTYISSLLFALLISFCGNLNCFACVVAVFTPHCFYYCNQHWWTLGNVQNTCNLLAATSLQLYSTTRHRNALCHSAHSLAHPLAHLLTCQAHRCSCMCAFVTCSTISLIHLQLISAAWSLFCCSEYNCVLLANCSTATHTHIHTHICTYLQPLCWLPQWFLFMKLLTRLMMRCCWRCVVAVVLAAFCCNNYYWYCCCAVRTIGCCSYCCMALLVSSLILLCFPLNLLREN